MYKELLAHTPVLMLPLAALVLFVAVFVAVVVATMTRRAATYSDVAHLPLLEEEEDGHGDA